MSYRRWMLRLARASERDKSMFSEGQKVWHRDGQRSGTVLEWRLPIKSLLERTRDLKLITDYQYRSMTTQYNKAFRDGEPTDIPIEQPRILRDSIAYYRDRLGYSAEDLARLLSIHVSDVEAAYLARPPLRLVVSR
jgi:hypothetical protein